MVSLRLACTTTSLNPFDLMNSSRPLTASLRAKPEPDATRRTVLGEALEDRADRADDDCIRMEANFAIGFPPDKANGQAAAQFPASGLVADAVFEPSANDILRRKLNCFSAVVWQPTR